MDLSDLQLLICLFSQIVGLYSDSLTALVTNVNCCLNSPNESSKFLFETAAVISA